MTNNQAYATMFTVMNKTPHHNKKPKNNKEKEPSFTRKVFSADPKYAHIGLEAKEVAYARRLLTGLVLAGVALGNIGFAKELKRQDHQNSPNGTTREYVIEPGDTLWGLATENSDENGANNPPSFAMSDVIDANVDAEIERLRENGTPEDKIDREGVVFDINNRLRDLKVGAEIVLPNYGDNGLDKGN